MFRAGYYETEITPPLGSIIPGSFEDRRNETVMDPLYARAVVYALDDAAVGIVSLDCCGITADIAEGIRKRAASLVPLAHDAVMVNATHCHGGGPTLNWGEAVVRDEGYIDFLIKRAGDALVLAWQRLTHCTLAAGTDELQGYSFIRDFHMKDGRMKTNPGVGNPDIDRPTTEPDYEVRVIVSRNVDGKPTGALVNFACHPAIVARNVTSSDYIGALSARMKELYGPSFVTVFLNGACGNINHVNPFDRESVRPGIHIALGRALAEKAALAIGKAEEIPENLACAFSTVNLRLRKPTTEQVLAAKAVYDALGDDAEKSVPRTKGYIETFFAWQAFGALRDRRMFIDLPVQVLTVGGVKLFACPCQIFVEYGRAMKAAYPGAMVCAFSNDYGGYVPTPDCMVPGIYEARLATTSQLEPAAGDKLVEALLKLAQ